MTLHDFLKDNIKVQCETLFRRRREDEWRVIFSAIGYFGAVAAAAVAMEADLHLSDDASFWLRCLAAVVWIALVFATCGYLGRVHGANVRNKNALHDSQALLLRLQVEDCSSGALVSSESYLSRAQADARKAAENAQNADAETAKAKSDFCPLPAPKETVSVIPDREHRWAWAFQCVLIVAFGVSSFVIVYWRLRVS